MPPNSNYTETTIQSMGSFFGYVQVIDTSLYEIDYTITKTFEFR